MLLQSELISILDNVLGQRGRVRKGGSQLLYHCPMCADKNLVTQKLEVSISGPMMGCFHCWRCDFKGRSLGSLLYKLKSPQSYRDTIFKLTGDIQIARHYITEELTYVSLPLEFHPMHQPKKTPEYKNAMAYLKRRGITREDILRYNIGYCESGEYEAHVIIPSYDSNGVLNFFIGRRYYTDDTGIPHKKPDVPMNTIIGFESFINWNEPLNLVEGVFDAFAVRNNAIPLFGKYPSQALRERMNQYHVKRVNVVLDLDAESDSIKMYQRLRREVPMLEIFLVKLDGKDPSKLGFEKTHRLIQDAREFDDSDLLKYKLQL